MTKQEVLTFNINRFDHYFESVNSKSNYYLAFNTLLLGGIATSYDYITDNYEITIFIKILLLIVFLSGITSMLIVLFAVIPKIKSKNREKSIFAFFEIATDSLEGLESNFNSIDQKKIEQDLINQNYQLSRSLKQKFTLIQKASWCILIEVTTLIPLIIMYLINI